MVKHIVGKGWAGWEVFIAKRNDTDPYQAFCRKLVPCTRSDDPKRFTRSTGSSPLTYTRSSWNLAAVIFTIRIQIIKPLMDELLTQFFNQHEIKSGPETHSVSDIFNSSFVLGELSHENISPKRFLIENMPEFKKNGFDTLYFEHLYYDNQTDLDTFNKTGLMSEALKDQLETLDDGNLKDKVECGFTFTQILIAAQKEGIRIVATDTGATYSTQHNHKYSNPFEIPSERLQYFSYTACRIIEEDQRVHQPQGKWIALMGAAHVSKMHDIPGVGDLLGVRQVVISDATVDEDSDHAIKCSLFIKLNPEQSTVLSTVVSASNDDDDQTESHPSPPFQN